jgi:hypothetical protein
VPCVLRVAQSMARRAGIRAGGVRDGRRDLVATQALACDRTM